MHLAIDDTYGPKKSGRSRYVTGNRRTHLGIIFKDAEVDEVRRYVAECLDYASQIIGRKIEEFHFVDLYNRQKQWANLAGDQNLGIFVTFAHIYSTYRWPIVIQTIDDRTLSESLRGQLKGKVDGLNLSKPADLSLVMLCYKIQCEYVSPGEPLHVLVDQGVGRQGSSFGKRLFKDWPGPFEGHFVSSKEEPLVQIADFVAYCINRSTVLALKEHRSETDNWFLKLVGTMGLNSPDIQLHTLPVNFGIAEFDEIHRLDRVAKGIERS